MSTRLLQGSNGKEVRELQESLKVLGFYDAIIDGDYGRLTRAAVCAFQNRYFVDGIADRYTRGMIDEAFKAWANTSPRILVAVPDGLKAIEQQFGEIEYTDAGGGFVYIVNKWDEDNIIHADFPVIGKHLVHYKIEPVLEAVMTEIMKRGLDGEILQSGIWCPRHKMHDPTRGLSTHSWGIAIDLNIFENPPGFPGKMHIGIVEVFEMYGWEWGGRWKFRDDMHFQLGSGY